MKAKLFRAADRGYANYDWLQANYSFSFSNYYNPSKENFGALRVLNDDIIRGGTGFGEHPHQNMEIISIPLHGSLKHKDSVSNSWVPLHTGEVQVMTAGSGIMHAERNNSSDDYVNLFQIWIIPDEMNVKPAYAQMKFDPKDRVNSLQKMVSSYKDEEGSELKIHQDAQISRIDLTKGKVMDYTLISTNHGVYAMVISGELEVNEFIMQSKDALGIWQTDKFSAKALENTEILFIEVPMIF